jgi:hypothetical protein
VAPQRTSPTDQRDRDRSRVSRLLKSHAPPDWERRFRATESSARYGMVTAAALPRKIVANVFLGGRLREGQDGVYEALGVRVNREFRPTKEYPRGQDVYALTFEQDGSEPESPNEDADGTASRDVVDLSDATGDGDGEVS